MRSISLLVVLISAACSWAGQYKSTHTTGKEGTYRIRFDPVSGKLTFRRSDVAIRIKWASMFGLNEPLMLTRDYWISKFEEDYSDRIATEAQRAKAGRDPGAFVEEVIRSIQPAITEASVIFGRAGPDDEWAEVGRFKKYEKLRWVLAESQIFVDDSDPRATLAKRIADIGKALAALKTFPDDPKAPLRVNVLPLLVAVERKWHLRQRVLSENREAFRTGKNAPDVVSLDKGRAVTLVSAGYALALDEALDQADTYGDPKRKWREAFMASLLADGKFISLGDPSIGDKTYMIPTSFSVTPCIFYSKALFKQAGIAKPPRTWPQFISACEKLKSAGIIPLTCDGDIYCDMWMAGLVARAIGPAAWRRTIAGVASDGPEGGLVSDPPWTDVRYKEVFTQIRALHRKGYFAKGFSESAWPRAQHAFATGEAGMIICGSWLNAEIRNYVLHDPRKLDLGAFSFPRWTGGDPLNQTAALGSTCGLVVCRKGQATDKAIELLKYITAKEHGHTVHRVKTLSCMKDADYPESLEQVAADVAVAPVLYGSGWMPGSYAGRFNRQVIAPTYVKFFLAQAAEDDDGTVDRFLKHMQQKNSEYLAKGGEAPYKGMWRRPVLNDDSE